MKRIRTVLPPQQNPRGGTTLTEVLMALLCMGIGVVAVASLFPIALLRSAQATQLTTATILRFNAETTIDLYNGYDTTLPYNSNNNRNLIYNPDLGTTSDTGIGDQNNTGYLIDPLGAMIVRTDQGRPIAQTDKVGMLSRYDAMGVFNLQRNIGKRGNWLLCRIVGRTGTWFPPATQTLRSR